ncbi:MAG TPA: hypothetical protein VLQ45_03110 [Thermoanaerobaculia bacterium]|nr:hypothetical protein [Thermoanaerobaculia bacterium]
MKSNIFSITCLAAACCLGLATPRAGAAIQPSSDLLLPYFEVDAKGSSGRTTLFAVGNHSEKPVEVQVSVHTNWGLPVLDFSLKLGASQVRTVNLRDWLLAGELPDRKLGTEEISHLQAVLSGRASPRDQRYFSTEVEPGLAVGSITFRVRGLRRPEALWGDFFLVDPAEDHLQAETLVSLGRSSTSECIRHGVRFLAGGDIEAGTELVIWSSRHVEPSSSPQFPDTSRLTTDVEVYNEAGREIGHHRLSLLPVQKVDVAAMELSEPFGWFDLVTDEASIVTTRHGMGGRSGVSVQTFCLSESLRTGPALRIEQLVNGDEAAVPPGLLVAKGSPLRWTYTVTNAGSVPLDSILVTNNLGIAVGCPESSLGPGRTMTCEAFGIAEICSHEITAMASGVPPTGSPILAQDTSYYSGDEGAAIDLELFVNNQEADEPPGPHLVNSPWPNFSVSWRFRVTNSGETPLSNVTVVSDQELSYFDCPEATLAPGESLSCGAASNQIATGPSVSLGRVQGTTPCGDTVSALDPAYYVGKTLRLALSIETLINGQEANSPPGPNLPVGTPLWWTGVVRNTGDVTTFYVMVDSSWTVCPSMVLGPGEAMTCHWTGWAQAGQQQVVTRVSGMYVVRLAPPLGTGTSATDVSYYVGVEPETP